MTATDPGNRRLRVLQVILVLGETNSQYNQHCLPLRDVYDVSVCTYFTPRLQPPPEIEVFAGDDTLRGFFRAFDRALAAHEYDVIHAHAPHTSTLVSMALAARPRRWRLGRRLVYTVRDSFEDYKPRNKLLMLPALATWRRVVFCGRAAFESYPASWRRLVRRRVRVVQNAADLDRIDRVLAAGAPVGPRGGFDVLSIGRLEPVKDPTTLLTAFSRLEGANATLSFIGAGSLESELRERIGALGLDDRVQLTGLIPRDEVFVRCAAADLCVSASLGEGLPVAVIEAMATGCPVVLSDIPPHREVADGLDVIPFVAPGDDEGFARAIERFRAMPPSERGAIAERCREHARSRFALPRMHAEYDEIYREVR